MLNKEQLHAIRKALPENGYQLISDILGGKSLSSIRMILTDPERYQKNKNVIDTAIKVAEAHTVKVNQELDKQKQQVKSLAI